MSKDQDYAKAPDLRDQVPDLVPYLRPTEKVIVVKHAPTPTFSSLPDYREELAKLCGVNDSKDIGKNGPAMASRSMHKSQEQELFKCRFGRDGIISALNFMHEFPLLARTTLLDFASLIGMTENTCREEEYGRMFHEARENQDPKARELTQAKGWGWPFYASVDATPLFVKLLFRYCTQTKKGKSFLKEKYLGRDKKYHTMQEALSFSMLWILSRLHRNPYYFLEYKAAFPDSHLNQVLEDSYDSHFHQDGSLPDFSQSITSTEVQGLAYDALMYASRLLPDTTTSQYYLKLARQIRRNILKHLWIEGEAEGYFAVGADKDAHGQLRPMKVRKAIPFFLLNSHILDKNNRKKQEIIQSCIQTIFSPSLLAAGGIRSLATNESRFMPGAYHNGSVWPIETFEIAQGLRKQGFPALAVELENRLLRAIETLKLYPEFLRGGTERHPRLNERVVEVYDSADQRVNRKEQPPQQIQLWTLSAYGAITFQREQEDWKNPVPTPFEEKVLSNL